MVGVLDEIKAILAQPGLGFGLSLEIKKLCCAGGQRYTQWMPNDDFCLPSLRFKFTHFIFYDPNSLEHKESR